MLFDYNTFVLDIPLHYILLIDAVTNTHVMNINSKNMNKKLNLC